MVKQQWQAHPQTLACARQPSPRRSSASRMLFCDGTHRCGRLQCLGNFYGDANRQAILFIMNSHSFIDVNEQRKHRLLGLGRRWSTPQRRTPSMASVAALHHYLHAWIIRLGRCHPPLWQYPPAVPLSELLPPRVVHTCRCDPHQYRCHPGKHAE